MAKGALIHGTKGSPQGNWLPWLAVELKNAGCEVVVPCMPTPANQSLDSWMAAFDRQVGRLESKSLLVGHSVGAVFVLRLLERLRSPIAAAVLVSGFTGALGLPEYDALNSTFTAGTFNWPALREKAGRFICFAGDNDPYVPLAQSREIAAGLGVELAIVNGGGHLNAESGYTAFPLLLQELKESGVLAEISRGTGL